MYCQHCGKPVVSDARFCSSCGAATHSQFVNPFANVSQSRIVRPRYPRMVAGVCAGFALHFGWDITMVRILTVVFTLITSGVGLLVYIGAWILIPEAPYALVQPNGQAAGQQGTTA